MSPPKPNITLITLGAVTNNALMVALFNHFNGGDSIYFQPVLDGGLNPIENGFTPGEDSFLIEPVDSDESWQVNFRRTANDRGLVMIDPGNGITDSGTIPDPPVGATNQASGEVDYPWDMSVASDEVFVLEWFDSFMILPIASEKTYVSHSCHVGKIHSPFNSTDIENGLDGLGILCGKPFLSETSVAESWATATTVTQQIRIGEPTWVTTVTAWRSTTGYDALVGTRPDGVILRYQGRPIGVLKYVLNFTGSTEAPFERVFDSGGIAQYLYFFDAAAISTQVLPWVDGTPGPSPAPLISEVQQSAGMDHIYDFDFSGDPLSDRGAATAADFEVNGPWIHAAPTVTGTKGSYENQALITSYTLGTGDGPLVDLARTGDVWYEGIWSMPTPGPSNSALATAGLYNTAQSHSFLVWSGSNVKVWSPAFATKINATALDATYMIDPTYIAVWWDHANTVYRLYYRKIGQSETALVSASTGAGSAGSQSLWAGGRINIASAKMVVHMFALHRGELTSTHRNNIYAAMGI